MKILILHQAPFKKMRYDRVIDHHQQRVVYIGLAKHLDDLPAELPCKKIVLPPAAEHNLVAEVLARVNADDDYTSLLALSEYGILEACEIRAALGLSGPSYEQIARVRDKVKMKQRIAARGTLRYPRFIASPLQIAQAGWHGKTITKPRDGASSQGVILHQDFLTAVAYLEEKSGWENHELEEFIDAPLYHFDGVVINGEVQHLLASRYINSPLAYLDGVPVGSFQVALKDTFRQFINEVIAALGIVRGCFHIEAFYDGETCIFLEAANRLGGARIVETHQLKTGVHLPSEEISDLLGLPHQQHSSTSQQFFGFLLYPSHFLNETEKLIIPEEIKESSHLISFQRGEVDASEVTYNEDRLPLSLVASADTPDQLHSFLTRCLAEITIN